jgi:CheY-like chemotaxis protein
VILLDLMMPRLDGFEFLERLDQAGRKMDAVVIVMTAFDAWPLRKLPSQNVHAVVHKPFDVERLVEMVRDCAQLRASALDQNAESSDVSVPVEDVPLTSRLRLIE